MPFTEDEEKKSLFINNKTITIYRSDLPSRSSCPNIDIPSTQSGQNISNLNVKDVQYIYEQTKDWKQDEIYEGKDKLSNNGLCIDQVAEEGIYICKSTFFFDQRLGRKRSIL